MDSGFGKSIPAVAELIGEVAERVGSGSGFTGAADIILRLKNDGVIGAGDGANQQEGASAVTDKHGFEEERQVFALAEFKSCSPAQSGAGGPHHLLEVVGNLRIGGGGEAELGGVLAQKTINGRAVGLVGIVFHGGKENGVGRPWLGMRSSPDSPGGNYEKQESSEQKAISEAMRTLWVRVK
jgi:hypothetical protein